MCIYSPGTPSLWPTHTPVPNPHPSTLMKLPISKHPDEAVQQQHPLQPDTVSPPTPLHPDTASHPTPKQLN